MQVTKSEDCLIFNGLTPELTKTKKVYDALHEFMKKKQSFDPSDRFNLIVFEEDGPSYLENFTLHPEHVLDMLQSLENKMVPANIAGGIFIAITFIIDVFKKISEKVFRLIILVDASAPKIPPQYLPVLKDLIRNVKDMPFFIDIISINFSDSNEIKKFMGLANLCNGELYNINRIKDLESLLLRLSEKKYIRVHEFYFKELNPIISKETEPFFINLADDPIQVKEANTCTICFQKDSIGIVQCPSCDIFAHKACWAKWAKTSNIGIPYVFRCHNCFNILKLDKQFVYNVQTGKIPIEPQLEKLKKVDLVKYLENLESAMGPKVIHVEDPMAIGGFATEYDTKFSNEEILRKEKTSLKVVICPNCSYVTTNVKVSCPKCGFQLIK
jgi:hypothetical protein